MIYTSRRSYFLRTLVLSVSMVFSALAATAQQNTKPLLLNDAITLALEQNRQIGLAKTAEKISLSQFKQTEAIWLPQVNLSYTGFTTNQPLNAFGFKLQQSQVQASDFNPATLNHPGATSNVMTQLSVQQPIFNPDMNYLRKAALKEAEVYAFKTQRTKEAITLQVTNSYLQLEFAYEAVKVLQEALATVREIYRFTNDRYQQGLLQKSDLLQVEVQVKTVETNLAEANSQISNISDQLSQLMNTATGQVYTTQAVVLPVAAGFTDSVSTARADIKAMNTALSAYDLAIKSTQKSMLPRLNAFGNYQLNDQKLFGFGANAYFAGIQLSWDIFKGNQAKNKAATQTLEKTKLQEQLQEQLQQGTVEIRKTKRQLDDTRFRISQQTTAAEQAEEALRIIRNRYSQGLVNTTDVLMAQSQLAQQKMLLAQALFMQKSTLTYLQFLTTSK
ncbi:MAG: TolC family protein [Bacteroidetes bacterium]|nr:TolC family protein [Bacteroidota bacterium]